MNYRIMISEVNREESRAKAYATVVFGNSLVVRNIAVVERKDGNGYFISMPSQKTKGVDEYNNPVYKDICNPITADFQQELSGAILEAYELKKAGQLDKDGFVIGEDSGSPAFNVRVTPYERQGSNIRGFASVYLEDSFVVSSISIISGRNGEFVSMPAYKAATSAKNGESAYKDIVYPITKEFREQLFGEILNTYHEAKDKKMNMAKETSKTGNGFTMEKTEDVPFR